MSRKKPITTRTSQIAWECPWYRVRRDEIALHDGTEGIYNVLEVTDSVFIVPVLEDGRIVLIHNYRHTLGDWTWEVPAGSIMPGHNAMESAHEELREEAGGIAAEMRFLLKANTMNGIGQQSAHFFLATGVHITEPEHEALEFMTIHPMPAEEAFRLATSGEMNDAVSITALLLAKPYLDKNRVNDSSEQT